MRDKPCLTAADIQKAMAACKAEAERNKWNVSIAIVDDGGFLLHFDRMDGAPPISAEVAIGKARTAALTKRPSKFFEDRVKERPAFANFPAGILIQGGLPILCRNECVGAIGVSGVQSHEDEQVAQAGVATVK
jgi:glc operon protein GlcG